MLNSTISPDELIPTDLESPQFAQKISSSVTKTTLAVQPYSSIIPTQSYL